MTFANKNALAQVELVDRAHYFGVIETAVGPVGPVGPDIMQPTYGLVDARFPDATEPVDADNIHVVVAEDVTGVEEVGPLPVLTLMLKQESPDGENVEAEGIILLNAPPTESDNNPVLESPRHAGIIISAAVAREGLERVRILPDNVVGISDRYLDAASFLVEAGCKQDESGEGYVFELAAEPFPTHGSDSASPELLAA
ncbi:MAG TPA: hypothetical protein VHB72_02755 [Candidatus Saccharimonadales bacterium]|nr:hypothetical protein [Candidatus Saccharimonadales bacterium]